MSDQGDCDMQSVGDETTPDIQEIGENDEGYGTKSASEASDDTVMEAASDASDEEQIDANLTNLSMNNGLSSDSSLPSSTLLTEANLKSFDKNNGVLLKSSTNGSGTSTLTQSVEPIAPTTGAKNNGVILSSLPTADVKPSQPAAQSMNKGILLKNVPNGSGSKTLTAVKPQLHAADSSKVRVKVKCMNGKQVEEDIDRTTTVERLKQLVHDKTGISTERQNLLYQGKSMTSTRTMASYSVTNGAIIQMAENRCTGG